MILDMKRGNVVGVSKREQDPSAKGHLTHLNDTLSTITNAVLTHKTEEGGCRGLKSTDRIDLEGGVLITPCKIHREKGVSTGLKATEAFW